jgi:site-specific recombinase XerD
MTYVNDSATTAAGDFRVGRLSGHLDGFETLLRGQGYARATLRQKRDLLADFCAWVERHDVPPDVLGEKLTRRFLREHRHRGAWRGDSWTVQQFIGYLRGIGSISMLAPEVDPSAEGELVGAFGEFLRSERGLSASTLTNYLPVVRDFLAEQFHGRALRFDDVRAADVHRFIVLRAQAGSLTRAKLVVTALRSFLRFLQERGLLATDLAAAVPGVAGWRLSHLPKALPAEQVERLLASCDRGTPAGRRDYAILMLLARLGLRGGEVSALTLDDIDWECGEIVVHGKGQRLARLPLPTDVGSALVDYLRQDRPVCSTRRVFIRVRAPRRGFVSPSVICCIVRRALKRAGLTPVFKGAHLLRHSLATDLLRRGASLVEIGQLLRHSQPNTTQIYAKVDIAALRAIALPWPGAAS